MFAQPRTQWRIFACTVTLGDTGRGFGKD